MRTLVATLAVIALLFSAGAAWADFDNGVAAAQRGDYATALREFRPLAEQGNAEAQFNLGIMYAMGTGVSANNVRAYMWFSLAKAQGYKNASKGFGIVKSRMPAADISIAQALATEMWTKINN